MLNNEIGKIEKSLKRWGVSHTLDEVNKVENSAETFDQQLQFPLQ